MWRIVPLLLVLTACTSAIELRHPDTGQTATCGPYNTVGFAGIANAQREAKCIDDYQRQGYVRVSN